MFAKGMGGLHWHALHNRRRIVANCFVGLPFLAVLGVGLCLRWRLS